MGTPQFHPLDRIRPPELSCRHPLAGVSLFRPEQEEPGALIPGQPEPIPADAEQTLRCGVPLAAEKAGQVRDGVASPGRKQGQVHPAFGGYLQENRMQGHALTPPFMGS